LKKKKIKTKKKNFVFKENIRKIKKERKKNAIGIVSTMFRENTKK
jgi:hypothetical protein